MIKLSTTELIDYFTLHHPNDPLIHKNQFITNSIQLSLTQSESKLDAQNEVEIDLSDLTYDCKVLESRIETDLSKVANPQIINFINSQQIHKQKFLHEIKQRGLHLKQDSEHEQQGSHFKLKSQREDILINLSIYLSPFDIFKFFTLNKSLYTIFQHSNSIFHILYNKKYSNFEYNYPNPYNQDWKSIFKLRTCNRQKVYTWGESNGGRLGYLSTAIPQDHLVRNFGWVVHTPTNVSEFNHFQIIDILSTGYSFIILLNNGDVWYSGMWWKHNYKNQPPGPIHDRDYDWKRNSIQEESMGARRQLNRGVLPIPLMTQRYEDPQEDHEDNKWRQTRKPINNNFLSKFELPPGNKHRIISISCGREHLIALNENNQILTWDSGNVDKMGVVVRFENLVYNKVLKIVAGWNSSGCLIENVGLVIWCSREPLTKEQVERNDHHSNVKYFIIPNSKNNIVDFTIGNDFILYITKSDNLLKILKFNVEHFANETTTEINHVSTLEYFNQWKSNQDLNNIEFTKVCSNFNNFIVYTNHDQILLGKIDDDDPTPIIIPELQKSNIITIEMGDYHYLALTSQGKLLSWGVESKTCGCLGLGPKETILQKYPNDSTVQGNNLVVTKPKLIPNPSANGKWVSIAANGWHSGGIYVPEE